MSFSQQPSNAAIPATLSNVFNELGRVSFDDDVDFDFFTVNFPDGSSRVFNDEKTFLAFVDYLRSFENVLSYLDSLTPLFPTDLSVAISAILGIKPLSVLSVDF